MSTSGGRIITCQPSTCEHDHHGLNSPTGCCEHGPYLYFCRDCAALDTADE